MKRLLHKWKTVLLLLLVGGLIVASFNHMVGGFNEYWLGKHISYWNEQEGTPTPDDVIKMDRLYQSAINHTPHAPEVLQLGGHLSEWQAYIAEDDTDIKKQHFSEALSRYRASIEERTTWPYAWFDLAKAKVRASEVDEEFQTALLTSIRLGPNERTLQTSVVQLGLLTWHSLDEQAQNIILETLTSVYQREPRKIYQAAKDYQRTELFCSLVDGDAWVDAKCTSVNE